MGFDTIEINLVFTQNHARDSGHFARKHGFISQISGNSAQRCELPLLSAWHNLYDCVVQTLDHCMDPFFSHDYQSKGGKVQTSAASLYRTECTHTVGAVMSIGMNIRLAVSRLHVKISICMCIVCLSCHFKSTTLPQVARRS